MTPLRSRPVPARIGRFLGLFRSYLILASLSACAGFQDPIEASCPLRPHHPIRVYGQSITELTYRAVDKMTVCLTPEIARTVSIVVSSLTDAQRIDQSSTFGNIVADFARSRLAQDHFLVAEPRLRSSMLLKRNEGEMMLGRDPSSLVAPPAYSAILTGTYAVGESEIYVDLKLIRADTAQILSAADFIVVRSNELNALLNRPARSLQD